MGKKRVFILLITILHFTRFTPERQNKVLPNISKPKETPSQMIYYESSQDFLLDILAVPRLGNVRLRLHFLRHGTSAVIEAYQLIDASGKLVRASESKLPTITFSSNGLPTGFYSVILKTEKSVLTSKLVIQ